jgi:hypothetical protein
MVENIILPQELSAAIGSEKVDFAVKAKRVQPLGESRKKLLIGIAFLGAGVLIPITLYISIEDYSQIETFEFIQKSSIALILLLLGGKLLYSVIYALVVDGGYFVGTPTRLVRFQAGKLTTITWDQFSRSVISSGNSKKGNLSLEMKPNHDKLKISGIGNVFEIEEMCKRRILK